MATKFYTPQNTPQNVFCLRKADCNALLKLLKTLHCHKQCKNPNTVVTCRGFSRFQNPPVFHL